MQTARSQLLLFLGLLPFFIGLLTGFLVPMFVNPRMGLASHLEGIMNGLFLVVLGHGVSGRGHFGAAAFVIAGDGGVCMGVLLGLWRGIR